MSYVLSAVTTNEFLAPDYDYEVCANAECTSMVRIGDQELAVLLLVLRGGVAWFVLPIPGVEPTRSDLLPRGARPVSASHRRLFRTAG